ncbi:MAG TPA: hypothetical protein VLC55_00530 [Burkholderiales bacterium]|nr:hypothetical protein [Burkholderiales bacterium]
MVEAPSYTKWCDRKLWTVHEAVCLMLAVEPDTPWLKDHDYDVGGPLVEALEQYSELAAEAMKDGTLHPFDPFDLTRPPLQRRVIPRRFLDWAKASNIAIPEELTPLLGQEPPQPPAAPVSPLFERLAQGHAGRGREAPADAREQVLGAALAALSRFPERCRDAAGIRRVIEDNAPLIWSETRKPPLPAAEMEALVAEWLRRLG